MTSEQKGYSGPCVLELLGHRRLGCFIQEDELAGYGMFRVEIPMVEWDTNQYSQTGIVATAWYSPQAVYALTPCGEQEAYAVAARETAQPVSVWDVRALLPEITETVKREIEDEVRREYYAKLDAQQKRRTLTGTGANYDADEDEEMPL